MDLTGWLEFFVTWLSTQLTEVRVRSEQVIRADLIRIAAGEKLNARQTRLVAAFLERSELTLAECENSSPTSRAARCSAISNCSSTPVSSVNAVMGRPTQRDTTSGWAVTHDAEL
jgi:hypothetical protein